MTARERQQLSTLLEKAIRGDERAISEVCEFIQKHRKAETMNRLSRAGVAFLLDDAYQELLLTLQRKLRMLKIVDAFEPWFWRLTMSVATQFRPRYVYYNSKSKVAPEFYEHPKEIGAKTIHLNGNLQTARIFEPLTPRKHPLRKRLFESVNDVTLAKASMLNQLNYPRKIDVWEAMAKLPARWADALRLMVVEGRSAAEIAIILGCSVPRVFRLVQLAKQRMRELLPGYSQTTNANWESQSVNGDPYPSFKNVRGVSVFASAPHRSTNRTTRPRRVA